MNEYKICTNCGARNPQRATNCLACGRMLEEVRRPGPGMGYKPNFGNGNPGADPVCDLIDYVTDATVFVASISFQSGSTGTGFFIKHERETYLVTNLHVVESVVQGGFVTVRFSDRINPRKDNFNADVVWFDPVNDLALLEVHCPLPPSIRPMELADTSSLRNGQDILSVGNPRDMKWNVIKGCIAQSNYSDNRIQMSRVLCSLNATHGNSGGPVVRISDGKVIGVATEVFIPEYMQSHTICVSTDAIRQLIYMYKNAEKRG